MSTLVEIQGLVNEAQRKIREGDRVRVQTVLWPQIKTTLSQSDDLEWKYRGDMAKLIYKHLDEQNLQGGPPTPINLEQLKADLQAGRVQAPEPARVYKWLPY